MSWHMLLPGTKPRTAICQRCGRDVGHPGPCGHCVPDGGVALDEAMRLAAELHTLHFRRGSSISRHNGVNFLCHPAEIVTKLDRLGFEVEKHPLVFKAAWLHDGPEDWGIPGPEPALDLIAERVDHETAAAVRDLTCMGDKSGYKASFGIDGVPVKGVASLIVKVVDQECNALDFHRRNPSRVKGYLTDARPVFHAMQDRREEIIAYVAVPYDNGTAKGQVVYDNMLAMMSHLSLVCGVDLAK